MKTLAKIIKRLLFGPSLEGIEARQKAENVKALKPLEHDRQLSEIREAGVQSVRRIADKDRARASELADILQMQIEAQLQIIEQTKRAAHGR